MCFTNKLSNKLPYLQYNQEKIEWVTEYLGVRIGGLEKLCQQPQRAQTVVDTCGILVGMEIEAVGGGQLA